MSYDTSIRLSMPLRTCAAHGHNFWLGYDSKRFGGRFFCPQYVRDMFEHFDPQPRPKGVLYGQSEGDHTVRLIEGGWPTPDTAYVVLDRKGDILTLRPLGMPEAYTLEVPVAACWPARYVRPSTRTCRK